MLTPHHPTAGAPQSSFGILATTLVAALGVVALGALGPNFDLAALSALVLVFGVACLWRRGEPPILLFMFSLHWLQATAAIFLASFANQPLDSYYPEASNVPEATMLSLGGITAMAIGMRLGKGSGSSDLQVQARTIATSRRMRQWFLLYATSWLVGSAATLGSSLVPSLSQVFIGISAFRWAFFFILAFAHFSRSREQGAWFAVAFCFELALGFGGYFSDFKTVFIVTILAMVMAGTKFTPNRVLAMSLVGIATFALGVVWTAIKPDYRAYVSGGARQQVVLVEYVEQVQKLVELSSRLDEKALSKATEDLFARLAYVEYFGSVIGYVPARIPHENGAILSDAIVRPFMPRLFFPEKTEINDSERTNEYSGRAVASAEQGTSISLGWMAELYIDFGRGGMLLAAGAVGLFYGLIQRSLSNWRRSRGLLGFAASCSVLLAAAFLESSITKVVGGVIAALLASFLIIRFLVPIWCPWIVRRDH